MYLICVAFLRSLPPPQPSLSGPGARVAVVCNVTPAAAQAEETANTLKFASRAKLVQVGTARLSRLCAGVNMFYVKDLVTAGKIVT